MRNGLVLSVALAFAGALASPAYAEDFVLPAPSTDPVHQASLRELGAILDDEMMGRAMLPCRTAPSPASASPRSKRK